MAVIDAPALEALAQLADLWGPDRFSLIGATALFIGLNEQPRGTRDIDVVVDFEPDEVPFGLDTLPGWHRDATSGHRWKGPGGVTVDVLPGTAAVARSGVLSWPDGVQMSPSGLDQALVHVFCHAVDYGSLRVAEVPIVVLLKMRAFLDRPRERERDLGDIAYALNAYHAEDARRFEEPVLSLANDVDEATACMLGLDLRAMLDAELSRVVVEFLDMLSQNQWALYVMARKGPVSWNGEPETAARMLSAFRRGFDEATRGAHSR